MRRNERQEQHVALQICKHGLMLYSPRKKIKVKNLLLHTIRRKLNSSRFVAELNSGESQSEPNLGSLGTESIGH